MAVAQPGTPLSRQERVIIAHIANGHATIADIAKVMGKAHGTVRFTLRNAYHRLGIVGAPRDHRYLAVRRAHDAGAITYVHGKAFPVLDPWGPTTKRPVSKAPPINRLILAALANGWSDQQIAHRTGRSLRSAKSTNETIYRLLAANNRAQATATAVRLRLIRWDGQQWQPETPERIDQ